MPEGGREGTQGCQLRLETAPVLLYRFLIIGVELDTLLQWNSMLLLLLTTTQVILLQQQYYKPCTACV